MIDFHTHIFPNKIAAPTLEFLESRCHTKPSMDGTSRGLLESAEKAGLDLSIILPVVTKPSQFDSINRFAANFQEGKLLSFGGIHPDCEDYKEKLRSIKEMGMKGIKLHPDYQETFFDDIRYKRIVEYASELGLIISVHAGFDPGYPDCIHCTPQRVRDVIKDVRPEKLVLAHLGGFRLWNEVEEYLVGENVWFDTAVIFGDIDDDQFIRIARNHGTHRILFATDCPWADQKTFAEHLNSLPLTAEEKRRIFHTNAEDLLGMKV